MDINKVILGGKVIRIFDLKYWPDGTPWMALTLATEKRFAKGGKESQYHRVVLVGRFAETIQTHLELQQEIQATGELTHRKAGEQTWISEVRVEHSYELVLGAKRRREPDDASDVEGSDGVAEPTSRVPARTAARPQSRQPH